MLTLSRSTWKALLQRARSRCLEPGQTLYEEEAEASGVWLVRYGKLEVFKTFFGERHRLTLVGRGDMLGETQLFEPAPCHASAVALAPSRVLELPVEELRQQVLQQPQLALPMLRGLVGRVRQVEQNLVEHLVHRNLEMQIQNARVEGKIRRRVKDLERSNSDLSRLAWIDPLTGCQNRRALDKQLQVLCSSPDPAAVVMIDVDHFKHYNDTQGHQAGDKALQTLVRLIQRRLRADDVLARYGGEEFCLILKGIQPDAAVRVCQRLREAIREFAFPHEELQPNGDFTVSLGLAMYPAEGREPLELLRLADARLYEAKYGGRDRLSAGPYTLA